MLLAERRKKTIYPLYTSLAGHKRPFSTVPLSPRVAETGIVRWKGWEMDR